MVQVREHQAQRPVSGYSQRSRWQARQLSLTVRDAGFVSAVGSGAVTAVAGIGDGGRAAASVGPGRRRCAVQGARMWRQQRTRARS
jgi:hypothetical protein